MCYACAMKVSLEDPGFALALAGGATGVLNAALMLADIEPASRFLGAIFGLAVVAALWRLGHRSPGRAVLILLAFYASWELAVQFAVRLSSSIEQVFLLGFVAGALGAAIVAAGFAVSFAGARRAGAFLRTVAIGAVAGMLLQVDNPFFLMVVWQTLVGASLGATLGRPPAG